MSDVTAGGSAPAGGGRVVDAGRLETLYVIYNARLVRYLRARLGARWELADDLAQDAWVRVAQRLHTCRVSDAEAFGWLCTVARSVTADHLRRARHEVPADFSGRGEGRLPWSESAEDVVVARLVLVLGVAA
ncbi:RNA polymerase sigma factor [Streptomyces sp. NPDC059477]|uniref:RNA polymerase sigma factor n=1 Tax=Streptomyces sp. NPDC059477 TaxID=3346847 RepID=UPI0036C7308C